MALYAFILALAAVCGVRADDFPFTDCTAFPPGIDPASGTAPKATEGVEAVVGADRSVTVTLRGTYKGFRIYAHDLAQQKVAEGMFKTDTATAADVKMLTCDGKADSGVAHKDSTKDLKDLIFTWTPAATFMGKIKFTAIEVTTVKQHTKPFDSSEVDIKKDDKKPTPAPVPTPAPGPAPGPVAPTAKPEPKGGSGRIDGLLQFLVAIGLASVAFAARHQRWMFL